jgi:hypothetical protein
MKDRKVDQQKTDNQAGSIGREGRRTRRRGGERSRGRKVVGNPWNESGLYGALVLRWVAIVRNCVLPDSDTSLRRQSVQWFLLFLYYGNNSTPYFSSQSQSDNNELRRGRAVLSIGFPSSPLAVQIPCGDPLVVSCTPIRCINIACVTTPVSHARWTIASPKHVRRDHTLTEQQNSRCDSRACRKEGRIECHQQSDMWVNFPGDTITSTAPCTKPLP